MLMGRRRSVNSLHFEIYAGGFVGFILISTAQIISGSTDSGDVAAINNLYVALDYPALPHWTEAAGDPCGENWQGVMCNNTAIISIVLNGANLGGKLGDKLGMFSSIKVIDLSNNHIGGSIPSNLPATIQNFFLSANQFTGSIPYSLSSLGHLTAMSLNDNHLTGGIPDSFQILTGLINLDLSNNNLSGQLPPSMFNLLSLTTLHLQNNMLSGTLSVLQDLPLRDLNVEKNQFSGPVPDKMLNIPNFRKDGNPFDTSAAPLPSPTAPLKPATAPPFFRPPTSQQTPANRSGVPSATEESKSGKNKNILTTKRVVWISISSVLVFVIMALGLLLFMPRCCRAMKVVDRYPKQHGTGAYKGRKENPPDNGSLVPQSQQTEKDEKGRAMEPNEKHQTDIRRAGAVPKPHDSMNVQRMGIIPRKESHEIDITGVDMILLPPPPPPLAPPSPPPPPPRPLEVIAEVKEVKPATKRGKCLTTVKLFTIASLQQFTNSFSEDNLIGAGMLGSVYRAQLADGKLLAVKKLDYRASSHQKDDEFLELVEDINKIRHANVVELIGYCAEHGQRLLIYEYCSNGTLKDALHSEDEFKKQLSWNARIQIALGAARALEYLHEVCQPPVVHRNFKSANLLLDDDLSVRVSDCGLAPLISSGSVSQLSGQLLSTYGYGAPEFELGVYTCRSDVYSFGVVMLELLTGRKSHDRTRNRGEQFLVRWAIPQLHDIDALLRMVDPSLNGKYPAKSLSNFADIISRCVQVEPEFRPQMSEVVQDLLNMIRREPSQYRSEGGE